MVGVGDNHTAKVTSFSNSGNPVLRSNGPAKRIVVLCDDSEEIDRGEPVDCIIQKEHSDHYLALPTEDAPITKPDYSSSPNIPIHHDGKHGESVADTRNEWHSNQSVEAREFNPKTHGAPPVDTDVERVPRGNGNDGADLDAIADEVGWVEDFGGDESD